MGESWRSSSTVKVFLAGLVFFGAVAALVSAILMIIYVAPYTCGDLYMLRPGYQSACIIANDSLPSGSVDVKIENDTVAGARLETYVFTKTPERTFVPETINWKLEDDYGRNRYFYVPAIPTAYYIFRVHADEKFDISYEYFKSRRKHSRWVSIYSAPDCNKFYTGFFNCSHYELDARFHITCPRSTKGTLEVTVQWPRYVWGPKDYVMSCTSYPCTFELDDPKLVDHDLLFVTVNNGKDTYEVSTKGYENLSVWVPVTVSILVGGLLLALVSCFVGVVFTN